MDYKIINVKDYPELLATCIEYVSERWGLNSKIFEDCIRSSVKTNSPLPQWFFMLKDGQIIGGYSLMTNDFVSRQDLWPYLSNLYVEKEERGKQLGSVLLLHARKEAKKLGFDKLYLCTDHMNYYEKYGWVHVTNGYHPWNRESKIYESETTIE